MKVDGVPHRAIWAERESVWIVDQTLLPHRFARVELPDLEAAAEAIATMQVRGAPLIGATAAYGVALAMRADPSDESLTAAGQRLLATRPTAVNLRWAVRTMEGRLRAIPSSNRAAEAFAIAAAICDDDVETNRRIGEHGLTVLRDVATGRPGEPVNVLTHCNAGWLATVDRGTALAPIYAAHDAGLALHVWVDETRPRSQGALTAWELAQHGVPHTLVVDNAGGHLMQRGLVDAVIVGTDRTTATGDACNKIGTYLKALAARDNGVPFYVALPSATIDWEATDGLADIPIEERAASEVACVTGEAADGRVVEVRVTPPHTPVANPAFDVTPAKLVSGLITERGICEASADGLASLFPDRALVPNRADVSAAMDDRASQG